MSILEKISKIELFKRKEIDGKIEWQTGHFVGRPFYLDYTKSHILIADAWKKESSGVPQSCFLLAYYDGEMNDPSTHEAILLRVLKPVALPSDKDVVSSMIEYYKDNIQTGNTKYSQLDTHSRYHYSFSGLECAVLGCFYLDNDGNIRFGADLENFYSAHNYSIIKPSDDILCFIVNYREEGRAGTRGDARIGKVRYSSSQRFQNEIKEVPVYVQSSDFSGKRTALFGMTRTGKSNTVKKIIQACVEMSDNATLTLGKDKEKPEETLKPFSDNGAPKYPIGQIIFDINGEYANPNLQDKGTAIFDLYQDKTFRYSTLKKPGFKEMKVNFYTELLEGFDLLKLALTDDNSKYILNFRNVVLEKPDDYETNRSSKTRHDRKESVYFCCLHRAGFEIPNGFKVTFTANKEVRQIVNSKIDPSQGLTLEEASLWWEQLWEIYDADTGDVFQDYKKSNEGREWADDDLKALLTMLTRKRTSGGRADCTGFRTLKSVTAQHTATNQEPFDEEILKHLRNGDIVIVDLSLGNEQVQRMFTERLTKKIFNDAMSRFVSTNPNNFIQFYFEEAHNLFPKKDDKDLSQIYNKLAKEGAKLHIGLIYAVSKFNKR